MEMVLEVRRTATGLTKQTLTNYVQPSAPHLRLRQSLFQAFKYGNQALLGTMAPL